MLASNGPISFLSLLAAGNVHCYIALLVPVLPASINGVQSRLVLK
jgi:hypothetical protein